MPNAHPRPWHKGSLFGEGRRVPLDRERRARFRYLLNAHHRGGGITRAARDVGEALLRRLGTDGQCDPSHDTLATDAACSARTVRRATARMHTLGLLRWQQRLVRTSWRAEQTSNAYELIPSANPPAPCGGQRGRETRRILIPTVPVISGDRAEALAALARRRAAMEQRLLGNT
jgi:AraC-like DNA-binding protein